MVIDGKTEIGKACDFWAFCSVGGLTQDLKYQGGNPGVKIGDHTTLREYVTVNTATFDGDDTIVGSHCHIMAYSHVAHDCVVGNRVIIANAGTLAGHVIVEDGAVIGGLCGIHQFVRLGRECFIGGCSKITKDIPPYMLCDGAPPKVIGPNVVGLQRRGMSDEEVRCLKNAYRILYKRELTTGDSVRQLREEFADVDCVQVLADFVESSERGITR